MPLRSTSSSQRVRPFQTTHYYPLLLYIVLGSVCSGQGFTRSSWAAEMDAPDVSDPWSGDARARRLGTVYKLSGLDATTLLSWAGRSDLCARQRPRTAFRQHLAFACPAAERLCARSHHCSDHRRHDRLVSACALLGNADAQESSARFPPRPGFRWRWWSRHPHCFPRSA